MLWCYTEGVITVKVSVRPTSIIDNKPSILLHLVGFLSSRFTHDARSQEHKVINLVVGLLIRRGSGINGY